jgi:putative NADH-flavin reductase
MQYFYSYSGTISGTIKEKISSKSLSDFDDFGAIFDKHTISHANLLKMYPQSKKIHSQSLYPVMTLSNTQKNVSNNTFEEDNILVEEDNSAIIS